MPRSRRPVLPKELEARVLFASDRRCCICRREDPKVQIHHIDENPAHNDFANLAAVCPNCHTDIHARGGFVRGLSPDLVRLYNDSWRAIVQLRLLPSEDPSSQREYLAEVYLEVSLECHRWKNQYMVRYPNQFMNGPGGQYRDIWDKMITEAVHPYSVAEWERYRALFENGMPYLQLRLDRIVTLYDSVLPADFKLYLLRIGRELTSIRFSYLHLPDFLAMERPESVPAPDPDAVFRLRFVEALTPLRELAREADRRREGAVPRAHDA